MTSFHLFPPLFDDGNFSFSPFNSNINDVSLSYIPWSNITYKPFFSSIAFYPNYYDLINLPDLSIYASNTDLIYNSNILFSNLYPLISLSSNNSNNLSNFIFNYNNSLSWSSNSNTFYINNFNVGIGTSSTSYNLDVYGSINSSNYFINDINLSNIFISSNIYSYHSNSFYNDFISFKSNNLNISSFNNNFWSSNTYDNFIYYNIGNIGIGTSYGSYSLNILNSLNTSSLFINNYNISNIFISSNSLSFTSNNLISFIAYKFEPFNIFNIYNNNIGIGSTYPTEKQIGRAHV